MQLCWPCGWTAEEQKDALPPNSNLRQQLILNSSISLCFIFISCLMGLCCFCVPSCLHTVHVSVFDQRAGEPEESALEYIPSSQGNRSQILCKTKVQLKHAAAASPDVFRLCALLWEKSITVGYEVVLAWSRDLSILAAAPALLFIPHSKRHILF